MTMSGRTKKLTKRDAAGCQSIRDMFKSVSSNRGQENIPVPETLPTTSIEHTPQIGQ